MKMEIKDWGPAPQCVWGQVYSRSTFFEDALARLWSWGRLSNVENLNHSTHRPPTVLSSSSCKCKLWFSTAFLKLHIGRKIKHKSELGRRRNRCEAKTAWRSCNTTLGAHPAICNPWSTSSTIHPFSLPSTIHHPIHPSTIHPSIHPSLYNLKIL